MTTLLECRLQEALAAESVSVPPVQIYFVEVSHLYSEACVFTCSCGGTYLERVHGLFIDYRKYAMKIQRPRDHTSYKHFILQYRTKGLYKLKVSGLLDLSDDVHTIVIHACIGT